MEAIRETVDVVGRSVTVQLPAGFSARRVEIIVLPAPESEVAQASARRCPAPELAGTVILDDLIEPAVSPEDREGWGQVLPFASPWQRAVVVLRPLASFLSRPLPGVRGQCLA